MNKLMVMSAVLLLAMVCVGYFVIRVPIGTPFHQGFIMGLFGGAFLVFFLSYLRTWFDTLKGVKNGSS